MSCNSVDWLVESVTNQSPSSLSDPLFHRHLTRALQQSFDIDDFGPPDAKVRVLFVMVAVILQSLLRKENSIENPDLVFQQKDVVFPNILQLASVGEKPPLPCRPWL